MSGALKVASKANYLTPIYGIQRPESKFIIPALAA